MPEARKADIPDSERRQIAADLNADATERLGARPGGGAWVRAEDLQFYDVDGGLAVAARNTVVRTDGTMVPHDARIASNAHSALAFTWNSVYRPNKQVSFNGPNGADVYAYNARWESFSTMTRRGANDGRARIKSWWSIVPVLESYQRNRYGTSNANAFDWAVGHLESAMEVLDDKTYYRWATEGIYFSGSSTRFIDVEPRQDKDGSGCINTSHSAGINTSGFGAGVNVSVSTTATRCEETRVRGTTSDRGWFDQWYRPIGLGTAKSRELTQQFAIRWNEGFSSGAVIGHGIDACGPILLGTCLD